MLGKKYFLILNSTARSGKAQKDCERIISILNNKKIDFDFTWTKKKADAIDIASKACGDNHKIVVAVGGDGTICEVISGLFRNNETSPKPKLGVLHIGTSPDFNKYHNIPLKLEEAIDTLLQGKTKLIDIGKITHFSDEQRNKEVTSYFGSNVNVGLGPLIAGRANSRYRKFLGDTLGTLTAMLVSLMGFKKMDLHISIDEQDQYFKNLINLTVGKDPYLASGMRVLSPIRPDDARLYVLSMTLTSWMDFLTNINKLYKGNFLDYKGASLTYGTEIKINLNSQYPLVEFDGDVKGYLPATIKVIPKALELIAK